MKFSCQLARREGGAWSARHEGPEVGRVEVTAATREQVLTKLRNELQYRLEFCPCTGEAWRDVEIELIEQQ